MKTKFYLIIALMFLAFTVSAQKYNYRLTEQWTNGAWEKYTKTTNTYDANGNLTKATTEKWNTTTYVWEDWMMTSYTLNADGTVKESQGHITNNGNGWLNFGKSIFTYNAYKQVLTETRQNEVGAIWMEYQTITYTYNASGKVTIFLITQQSKNFMQTIYTYNSDGTLNQYVTQKWNTSNQWENLSRSTSTYASKVKTSDLTEKWVLGAWQFDSRTTITSNADGTSLDMLSENWMNEKWTFSSKIMYDIKLNHDPIQLVFQTWNTDLGIWEYVSSDTWDYNYTGIQPLEFAGKALKVFPNPFTDKLSIENGTPDGLMIQMFNINGQLVSTFTTNGSFTDKSFGSLKTGTYFMKISSPQNEQTIKLLKAE